MTWRQDLLRSSCRRRRSAPHEYQCIKAEEVAFPVGSLFRQEIGKTPGKHVEDLRLEAARRQLESTTASLEEVAKFSGFKSAAVLRRALIR